MPVRKTLTDRCKTTHRAQKARAKKTGVLIEYTWADLESIVPARCRWCGVKLTPSIINFDHDRPLARGGDWALSNLVAICASCNRKKGTLASEEYALVLTKMAELTAELGSDYVAKNVLARMAAGGAWIFH